MKIGKHIVECKPIKVNGLALDLDETGKKEIYVDATGNVLEKIQLSKAEFSWTIKATGEPYTGKTFKSFKGKPIKSFTKTKEIEKYDLVSKAEMKYFIENEHTYLVSGDSLKLELKEMTDKAISFKMTNSGFKIHRAFVYFDTDLDRTFMKLFRGDLRKVDLSETSKPEIEVQDDVASLNLDELDV